MSSESKRSIVVTGFGVFSPIGIGADECWDSLEAKKSGVSTVEHNIDSATIHGVAGEVTAFTEKTAKKQYLKGKDQRKSINKMCRDIQMGAAAAMMGIEHANLNLDEIDHTRMGIEFGANLMFFRPDKLVDQCKACVDEAGDFQFDRWGSNGLTLMEPLWMLKYLPNMPACHIGIFTDSRGPNNSVTLDEASAGAALTEGLNIMERGAADIMLVGGTGTRFHPLKAVHSQLWDQLAFDEANPGASCKPFDTNRSGQVVGEGAACFVLEEESHARARGANIVARLTSGSSSCVASLDKGPDTKQAVINAARAALTRAGLSPSDIGHVNAHGLGSVEDDAAEAAGLREVFGDAVPVTGLKGYFGNSGAGTGFLESVGSILGLQHGIIPGTLNCDSPDSSLGIDIVTEARSTENKSFLNINFTRLGQSSASIFTDVA